MYHGWNKKDDFNYHYEDHYEEEELEEETTFPTHIFGKHLDFRRSTTLSTESEGELNDFPSDYVEITMTW